jgi:carbonic anhydrase/acetyltransferase-like protein (isoleucine patch superfamily)
VAVGEGSVSRLERGAVYRYGNARPAIDETAFIAPNATVIGEVQIGEASSVWFGAVLRGDVCPIVIGKRTNIQDAVIIHGDGGSFVSIADDVTIGHGAIVHGCTIETGALIGMGAIVLDGAVIGAGALIGAGAVVGPGKMVEPGTLWVGCPARKSRELGPRGRRSLLERAEYYRVEALRYRCGHVRPENAASPATGTPS